MGRNKGLKTFAFVLGAGAVLSTLGYLYYKASEKMDEEELSEACLYMAAMDDEIARNELGEIYVNGEEVEFSSRRKSLKYRYDLFMEMYRDCSKLRLEREVKKFERRLESSKEHNAVLDCE